MLIKVEALQN